MHINKITTTDKKISKDGIIYALIFVLYIITAVLIFISAINFLRAAINTALGTPDSTQIENKYGQLDLANYSLVANKLGLKKTIEILPVPVVAPVVLEVATTTSPEVIVPTTTEEISPVVAVPKVIEVRPNIIITNSTTKAGLAATLKNKLTAVGYEILSTGNSRPALAATTIKIKPSTNPDSVYLDEIKKIVATSYDFVILPLDETASSDIEIVIGNK